MPSTNDNLKLARIANEHEREFLAICQQIHRNHEGFTSPAEHFLWQMVINYRMSLKHGDGITPEDVRDELKDFEENFADAVKIARRMNRLYPEAVRENLDQQAAAPAA